MIAVGDGFFERDGDHLKERGVPGRLVQFRLKKS